MPHCQCPFDIYIATSRRGILTDFEADAESVALAPVVMLLRVYGLKREVVKIDEDGLMKAWMWL